MGITKTESITLQAIPFQENSRIFKVFSKDLGVMSLIAKHLTIKKPLFLALTTPFCHGELVFKKSSSELFKLEDGSVINSHVKLREDFNTLLGANYLNDAILKIAYEDHESSSLFVFLERYLKAIENCPEAVFSFVTSFYLKLLVKEGVFHLSSIPNFCHQGPKNKDFKKNLYSEDIHQNPGLLFTPEEFSMLFLFINAKTFAEIQNFVVTKEFFEEKILKLFLSLT